MPLSSRTSDRVAAATLVAPATVLYTLFTLIPAVAVVGLAFFEWNFFAAPQFVGVQNFQRALTDDEMWRAALVTLGYLVYGVVPTVILGFLLAVLVNTNIPGIGLLRVLYFVPVVVSVAVSAVLWTFLFDPRQGPIAAVLRLIGVTAPDFFNSPTLALPSVTVVMVWASLPIVILFYLAALQRIPPDIYAAAALDGAGSWRTVWSITWPNVTGTTALITILQIANYSAASLDYALVLSRGGPLGASRSLALYSFEQAFLRQDVGYASTVSIFQVLMILVLLGAGQLITRRFAR